MLHATKRFTYSGLLVVLLFLPATARPQTPESAAVPATAKVEVKIVQESDLAQVIQFLHLVRLWQDGSMPRYVDYHNNGVRTAVVMEAELQLPVALTQMAQQCENLLATLFVEQNLPLNTLLRALIMHYSTVQYPSGMAADDSHWQLQNTAEITALLQRLAVRGVVMETLKAMDHFGKRTLDVQSLISQPVTPVTYLGQLQNLAMAGALWLRFQPPTRQANSGNTTFRHRAELAAYYQAQARLVQAYEELAVITYQETVLQQLHGSSVRHYFALTHFRESIALELRLLTDAGMLVWRDPSAMALPAQLPDKLMIVSGRNNLLTWETLTFNDVPLISTAASIEALRNLLPQGKGVVSPFDAGHTLGLPISYFSLPHMSGYLNPAYR